MSTNTGNLKEVFFNEATEVAARLREDPSTLAVILTGPLALGRASVGDKLYFAVITDKQDGVIEHFFLDDGWEEINRPIEMAKFPLAVVRYLLEKGYDDMVSYKTLEAFRCGQVLWQHEEIGTEAVEGAAQHIPVKAFVGEHLHGTVSDLDDAVSLLKNGNYANAVLVAREAANKAVGMVIKEKQEPGAKSFLEAARAALPEEQFQLYREIMGLTEMDDCAVAENAERVREFVEYVLREIGVKPEYVLQASDKERPV